MKVLLRCLVTGALLLGASPQGQASAEEHSGPYADVLARMRVPFQSWDLAAGFGSIWVSGDLGVSRIDPQTNTMTAEVSAGAVAGVAVGRAGVFISSYAADRVARVDPETDDLLWSTPVQGPLRIAVGAGALWSSSPVAGTVTRIDPGTGQIEDTITIQRQVPPLSGVGGEPDDRGFSPGLAVGGGSVWVASRSLGELVRIDPSTDRISAHIRTGGTDPIEVAFGEGAVWVTDLYARMISRIDAATELVSSFALPGYGLQIAVTPGAVWVTNWKAAYPHRSGIVQLDPYSGEIQRYLQIHPAPEFGFWGLALAFEGLWVTTFNFESTVGGTLIRIDPAGSLDRPAAPAVAEPDPGILPVDVEQSLPFTSGSTCEEPGPNCEQVMDVYRSTASGSHPVIVLAHEVCGGAGCRRYLAMLADVLATDGAVVFNVDFGDPQNGRSEAGLKPRDLACAVRSARQQAADFGGDPGRVTLVTHLSATWSGAIVALAGDTHVGGNCLADEGTAMPDALVGIADAPNRLGTPQLGANPGLVVRLITGARDAKFAPSAFRRMGAFSRALVSAGYDSSLTIAPHATFADPAAHGNIDIGSAWPTVQLILDAAQASS